MRLSTSIKITIYLLLAAVFFYFLVVAGLSPYGSVYIRTTLLTLNALALYCVLCMTAYDLDDYVDLSIKENIRRAKRPNPVVLFKIPSEGELLARMQTERSKRGVREAFNATPTELGEAAVREAVREKENALILPRFPPGVHNHYKKWSDIKKGKK